MKYSKYPSYRDSDTDWLGSVPRDWDIVRNKQAFNFEKDLVGKKSKDYTLLSLTLKGIKVRDVDSGKGKFPAEFDTYQKVDENDIVFCLFDIDETPRTVGISGHKGMITGAYNVARCNFKSVPKYIYYYYLSIDEYKGLKPFYTGLRKVVRTETFMNIPLALPNHEEQQSIANYLDIATSKIDNLIAKQTKLIELLKEKRHAVISTAVTRGLDKTVDMKDSGVEWLGEIPEHWNKSKLGYETKVKARLGWKGLKAEEYVPEGYAFLATPNIKNKEIDFLNVNYITKERYKESPEIMLEKGDVLVTKDGSTTGTTNVVRDLPEPTTVNSSIAVIRPRKGLHSIFLYYYFLSTYIQETINLLRGGMGVPHLFQADLRFFNLTLPSYEEQQTIANYLDDKTTIIDKLVLKATKAIELLKEKRTSLISSAVTGKIDVRDKMHEYT